MIHQVLRSLRVATLAIVLAGIVTPPADAALAHAQDAATQMSDNAAKRGKATLVGKVLDSYGKAVKSGFVEVWERPDAARDGHHPTAIAPISKKGAYKVTGLRPGRDYFVRASAPGHIPTWASGLARDHPRDLDPFTAVTRTKPGAGTRRVRAISLRPGGSTIKGKLAGHRKSDKVVASACVPGTSSHTGDAFSRMKDGRQDDFKRFTSSPTGALCLFGWVRPDGAYEIHGVPAIVVEVKLASSKAARSATLDIPAQTTLTKSFPALARTKGPKVTKPVVSVSGYFMPGFTVSATIDTPPLVSSGPPPAVSILWTDGGRILGSGPSLAVTNDMKKTRVYPIVTLTLPDRNAVMTVDDGEYWLFPAVANRAPVPAALVTTTGPVSLRRGGFLPWGATISAGVPPTGWSYTYQWLCDEAPIAGATSQTYTPVAADIGCYLRVRYTITAPNGKVSTSLDEGPYVEIAPWPLGGSPPEVPEKAKVGQTLRVANPPDPSLMPSYQWKRSGQTIGGASGSSYTVSKADRGKIITVKTTLHPTPTTTRSYVIGRLFITPFKPKVTLDVPEQAIGTTERPWIRVLVDVPHDPWSNQTNLLGRVKVKVGKTTYLDQARQQQREEWVLRLPRLPRGKYKVQATFIPDDKAFSTVTTKVRTFVVKKYA